MSIPTQNRVQGGTSDGGQFAVTVRAEPEVRLEAAPRASAPATLPRPSDLVPKEMPADGPLPAGWGLVDRRTGEIVHGKDHRRGRLASREAAQEWATITFPLIRKVTMRAQRVTLNPPGRRCVQCRTPLVQDISDETRTTVVTACDSCGQTDRTTTARPARSTR